ncbi:MAG: ATP-binding cassette domain-containing protein, partial [Proteobacteria bacterium]|nr:ATP-binding cassette domain-containing protein [Pseudomonadota bacterium]
MSYLLEAVNLNKRYPLPGASWLDKLRDRELRRKMDPQLHAVSGVSFRLERGRSLGLVGESGCGKSTLVNMLSRLSDPTSGAIIFDGKDIAAVPARRFGSHPDRANIQVVFQDPHESLNPRFTAFQVIADPLRRIGGWNGGAELEKHVAAIAEKVGLPAALLSRFPHQLSGGQKARVNIARAISLEPKLLVLDEPTSALDVSVQAVILRLLDQLRRDLGMTYLFVSHDLNVVRLLCDDVMVMYLGKIVEQGPAEEVFRDPRHPYTRALVSAIPDAAAQKDTRIRLSG